MYRVYFAVSLIVLLIRQAQACGLIRDRNKSPQEYLRSILWTYKDMDNWATQFPACNGRSQSPIDLSKAPKAHERKLGLKLDMNYEFPLNFELMNTGYTAELMIREELEPKKSRPHLTLGKDIFRFEQLHFHWGKNKREGSEHAFHKRKFPLEMHLVHSNIEFANFSAALGQQNGVAVLSVLFKKSRRSNRSFRQIVKQLPQISRAGQITDLRDPLSLSSLLPSDIGDAFIYNGSLTTPPCTESVTWIIADNLNNIGREQLEQFRKLHGVDGKHIRQNWRDLQNINGRTVKQNFRKRKGSG